MADWPFVGYESTVAMLRRGLREERVAGPPNVGKHTLARLYAQALNCLGDPAAAGAPLAGPLDAPCDRCRNCARIARDTYPDVEWFGLARQAEEARAFTGRVGANRDISIETVRALEKSLSLRPFEGRRRVAIIEEADRLSLPAANALLKTLEEPPSYAVLILLATDPAALLPTIVSRCRVEMLRPLPAARIEAALQLRWGVEAERAHLLAGLAGGRLGWAVSMAAQPEQLAARATTLTLLAGLAAQDLPGRFAFAAELAGQFGANRARVFDVLALWAGWWRDVLLVRAGTVRLVQNADRLELLRRAAGAYDQQQIVIFLAALDTARQQLEQNINPRLALESLVLQLPG